MTDSIYHIPALLEPTIEGLDIKESGVYADATFGGGGHSRGILKKLGNEGRLYGFDRDIDALANAIDDPRFTFVHSNFRFMHNFLRYHGESRIDGIVADLGVSFHHFDTPERGFSFRADAPLDMRMNTKAETSAATVVNEYSEEELADIFKLYGELGRSRAIAQTIVKARRNNPIATTTQLAETVAPLLDPRREKKEMAQLFQALRIAVNGEMDDLAKFLRSTTEILCPGGRLAILTYHSLEDRMVKNFMRSGNIEGKTEKDFFGNLVSPWKLITRTPITADDEEVERNPRARSAKLRIAELTDNNGQEK